MKKVYYFLTLAALFLTGSMAAQSSDQVFNELYDATEPYKTAIGAKIYDGAVLPVWRDANTFLYSTKEASGETVYEVNITGKSKTLSDKDALEALIASRHRPYYGYEEDDSYYSMGGPVVENSPDGKFTAYVRDSNIWIVDRDESEDSSLSGGKSKIPEGGTQLSFDGTSAARYVQIIWSPDSKRIAALKKDALEERQVLLRESRPNDQVQPKYRWLNYAKPGDVLPQSTPALFDVEKMSRIPFSTIQYSNQYFLELGQWSTDSKFFTFEYNQRGHQLYQLVAVNADNGENRVLAEEKSDTFVYYYDLYRHYFMDNSRILWISERDDWRHLYSINPHTGAMTQLTKGEWNVREILGVDEDKGFVYFYANGVCASSGEDPYNKHVLKLNLKTGKWKDLTPENAFHNVSFNEDYSFFVDNMSRPDLPTTTVLRSGTDGRVAFEIQKTDISALQEMGFTMPEVFVAKGRDGITDIWGTIYRPSHFNPERKYPVVEYIYAGPHDSHVEKEFIKGAPRFTRLLELGFIVVCIDGMGTDNRSKSFQDVAWRNLKDAGFPDRILWIKAAAKKYPYMDLSNMGIYGYSAGGQNTLSALLFFPEFYKVGVALCGCHDNRTDKIWWNEQWMGWPVGPWYSESSNVDNASRLQGRLFIINGEMDDNVDPASSLQVVAELVKNNKDFEQMYLPGHTHNLGSDYITRRVFKFFWENCIRSTE